MPQTSVHKVVTLMWLLVVISLCATRLCALDPQRPPEHYQLNNWNTSNGIPYTSVRHLAQSSQGFLWLSTRGGVARFDGLNFTAYTRSNTPELRNDDVTCIEEDASGVLWLATTRGILLHKDRDWWANPALSALQDKEIRWLERDNEDMYIATKDSVYVFRNNALETIPLPAEVKFSELRLIRRSKDRGWLISAQPSWWVEGTKAHQLKEENGKLLQEIWSAIPHESGAWLIGSESGLYIVNGTGVQRLSQIGAHRITSVRSLLRDRDDNLWIGTRGELFRMNATGTVIIDRPGVDYVANFLCLLEDKEGGLWGGNDSGLVRIGDVKASNITRAEGLPGRSVVSVLKTKDDFLWAGIWGGGLVKLAPQGKVIRSYAPPLLPSDAVWNLAEGPPGTLWMAFYNMGLGKLKDEVFEPIERPDSQGPRLRDMKADADGTVWISTWNAGLQRLRNGKFERIATPDLPIPGALLLDSSQRLWVSSPVGFGRVDKETGACLEHYSSEKGKTRHATAMLESMDGTLWVLRDEMTIERMRQGRVHRFVLPEWVGRLTYSGLIHEGELWVQYRNGIARIPLGEFDAVSGGSKTTLEFEFYNEVDGLRSVAPNIYTGQGATVAADGKVIFATSKGIASINPKTIRKITRPPTVVIDTVSVDKVDLPPNALKELAPGRGELAFTFTAMGLTNASQNKFRHRLLPLEKNWVEDGHNREAYYGSLAPGSYRFEVQACNADRVWTSNAASCEFVLPPHFYQTWWFYLSTGLGIPLLVLAYVRWRQHGLLRDKRRLEEGVRERTRELKQANENLLRQIQATEQKAAELKASETRLRVLSEELEERVKARTADLESFTYSVSHDLRAPLRGIEGWSLLLAEQHGQSLNEQGRSYLGKVREETKRLGTLIEDLLRLSRMGYAEMNVQTVDLSALALSTAKRVAELRPDRTVAFSCHPGLRCKADPALLEAALFNLLDNAWKFTGKTATPTVELGRLENERGAHFYVRDNGAGFDMAKATKLFGVFQRMHTQREFPGTGVGLATVRRIIQRSGGEIWAESKPGLGTCFHFTLPEE